MKRDLTEEQLRQEVTVVLPLSVVLQINEREESERPSAIVGGFTDLVKLPPIGAPFGNGIYAGISIEDNKPMVLVLLPGDEKMPWKDAGDWAKKQGGSLPSRIDQLVLFRNVKSEFKDAWYWSGEQYAGDGDYACYQGFSYGYQYYDRKVNDFRVRAVRRLPIQ